MIVIVIISCRKAVKKQCISSSSYHHAYYFTYYNIHSYKNTYKPTSFIIPQIKTEGYSVMMMITTMVVSVVVMVVQWLKEKNRKTFSLYAYHFSCYMHFLLSFFSLSSYLTTWNSREFFFFSDYFHNMIWRAYNNFDSEILTDSALAILLCFLVSWYIYTPQSTENIPITSPVDYFILITYTHT